MVYCIYSTISNRFIGHWKGGDNVALTKDDLQAIANLMDTKLQPINNRLDGIEGRLDGMEGRFDGMEGRLDSMEGRLDSMEGRFDSMEGRFDKIESELSSVQANQLELRKDVRKIKQKVDDTYELALDAWGTSTENREWLESKKLKI